MEVSLCMWAVILVEALWCANAQWNPLNRPLNSGENSKVSLSVSLSCILAGIVVFILFRFRTCYLSQQQHCTKPLPSTIEAIQKCRIFDYSTAKELKVGDGAEECAVCLVDFEDSDTIKMLPKCQHVFHQHCIDQWLPSRMTCPICRQKLITSEDTLVVDIDSVPLEEQQQHATETEVAVTPAEQPQPETDTVVEQVQFEVA